jgi:hypothetical protein
MLLMQAGTHQHYDQNSKIFVANDLILIVACKGESVEIVVVYSSGRIYFVVLHADILYR